MDEFCYVQTCSLEINSRVPHLDEYIQSIAPITVRNNAHYKRKVLHEGGWVGRSLPKPTKLDFNVPNPNRGEPYSLIPMGKSVHNGVQSVGS